MALQDLKLGGKEFDADRVKLVLEDAYTHVAGMTANMRKKDVAFLRETVASVEREAAMTGMTPRQVTAELLTRLESRPEGFKFVDAGNRVWDSRAYSEMLARTTLLNTSRQEYFDTCAENGADVVVVTVSGHCCDKCAEWENRLLSISGATKGLPTVDEATAAGLFHPNCTHSVTEVDDYTREEEYNPDGTPKNEGDTDAAFDLANRSNCDDGHGELQQSSGADNVDNFIPATTIEEAIEWTKINLADNVNWRGCDVETVNQINAEMDRLKHDYRLMGERYNLIGKNNRMDAVAHSNAKMVEFNWRDCNPAAVTKIDAEVANRIDRLKNKITMYQNSSMFSEDDKQVIISKIQEQLRYSRYTVGGSADFIKATVDHEAGHTLLLRKAREQWGHSSKIEDTAPLKLVRQTFERARRTGDIYKISEYANEDEHEFFAESLAWYRLEKSKVPDYIVSMIEEVVR